MFEKRMLLYGYCIALAEDTLLACLPFIFFSTINDVKHVINTVNVPKGTSGITWFGTLIESRNIPEMIGER